MLVITILIKDILIRARYFLSKHGLESMVKTFQFYKFRSMTTIDGEDEDRKKTNVDFMNNENGDADTKIINNSRVTWIGNLIRKSSLDELPQLFNVLQGEMSLSWSTPMSSLRI